MKINTNLNKVAFNFFIFITVVIGVGIFIFISLFFIVIDISNILVYLKSILEMSFTFSTFLGILLCYPISILFWEKDEYIKLTELFSVFCIKKEKKKY